MGVLRYGCIDKVWLQYRGIDRVWVLYRGIDRVWVLYESIDMVIVLHGCIAKTSSQLKKYFLLYLFGNLLLLSTRIILVIR